MTLPRLGLPTRSRVAATQQMVRHVSIFDRLRTEAEALLPGLCSYEERLASPSRKVSLPTSVASVYNIIWWDTLLKTGLGGLNSGQRLSHHFNGHAQSALCKTMRRDGDLP